MSKKVFWATAINETLPVLEFDATGILIAERPTQARILFDEEGLFSLQLQTFSNHDNVAGEPLTLLDVPCATSHDPYVPWKVWTFFVKTRYLTRLMFMHPVPYSRLGNHTNEVIEAYTVTTGAGYSEVIHPMEIHIDYAYVTAVLEVLHSNDFRRAKAATTKEVDATAIPWTNALLECGVLDLSRANDVAAKRLTLVQQLRKDYIDSWIVEQYLLEESGLDVAIENAVVLVHERVGSAYIREFSDIVEGTVLFYLMKYLGSFRNDFHESAYIESIVHFLQKRHRKWGGLVPQRGYSMTKTLLKGRIKGLPNKKVYQTLRYL